jgi:hypothetical protein
MELKTDEVELRRKVERVSIKDSDQKFAQGDSQEKPEKYRE